MTNENKVLIQIAILRAKLLLKEAEIEGFVEAKNCLKKEIIGLYAMLYKPEPLRKQGIHENLPISETVEIRLNGNLV